jgi:hypothetical protein
MINGWKCSSLFQTLPKTLEIQIVASFCREFSALKNDCLSFSNNFFLSAQNFKDEHLLNPTTPTVKKRKNNLVRGFTETSNMVQNSSQNSVSFNICSKILKEITASKFLFAGRMTSLLSFNST